MWIDGREEGIVPAANESQLVRQMSQNNIFGEWQESVLAQLARGDTATVEVPTVGQFSQGLP
jgi:hypothetical protein